MKIRLISIGKTDETEIQNLIEKYEQRLKYYISFEFEVIPDIKNRKKLSIEQQKITEGKLIMEKLSKSEITILLDEKGTQFTSVHFADELQKLFNSGVKKVNFIIGGPYGFSKEVYNFANQKIALSTMTFSHQMVRAFFMEQLYRAMTIIKNENYHHE
ncbi:MAG: 23S rRNA (pseudouridine(1915)-N(3))-methyltransferase RlmH [Flavobacteriales bacterium]